MSLLVAAPSTAHAFTYTTTVADTPMSVSVDAFVGAYYSYVFDNPNSQVSNGRLFASRHNTLTISGASIGVGLEYGPAFVYIAPWYGLVPTSIFAGEPTAITPDTAATGPSDATVWRYLREANAGFRYGAWKVDAGLFTSPIGIEGIAAKDNWLWSSSYQNYLFPFYHFGARVHYTTESGNTLGLWVVNGFSGGVDANDAKSIIVTAGGDVGEGSWQVLYYGGNERPDGGQFVWLHHLDAWISIPITDSVEVAAQGDVGLEPGELGVTYYLAGSVYVRVALADRLWLAVRGEVVREETATKDGVSAAPLFLQSVDWVAAGSIALELRPVDNSAIRLEYRHDESADPYFFGDENVATEVRQDAVTLGMTVWL